MKGKKSNVFIYMILTILAVVFLAPIFIILFNSFKGKLYISDAPFKLPTAETFSGLQNYIDGLSKTGFLSVMFTMSKVANMLNLDNPVGLIVLYLGFGAGLSIFMFSGFVKSIPIDIEEAALIDGCNPIKTFFLIVLPLLKPICITVAILNVMWIWNDYLLPSLVLKSDYKTIPMAVQYLRGGYGAIDMGAMMAVLVLAIIPIIIFYLTCQKYIIEGVAAGAVKG